MDICGDAVAMQRDLFDMSAFILLWRDSYIINCHQHEYLC